MEKIYTVTNAPKQWEIIMNQGTLGDLIISTTTTITVTIIM